MGMTQEEKAMAYDEAVKKAEEIIKYYKTHNRSDEASIEDLETIFPELKEGEDERIKKEILELVSISGNGNQFEEIKDWLEKKIEKKTIINPKFRVGDEIREALIKAFKEYPKNSVEYWHGIVIEDIITWLEKQGQQSVEPDWCHHKVDFSGCSEEYRKAYYDGWNNCNMQHSQRRAELDDVVKYLINGFKHYEDIELDATEVPGEWHTSIKHIIEVLERLSKMTQENKKLLLIKDH